MDKPEKFTLDFLFKLFHGDGIPVIVRYIYKWLGETKTEFIIGEECFTDTPIWLCALPEEKMQEATILEVVNPPQHCKGEWKLVFDEHKNVIVKYFPTPEEEAQHIRNMKEDEIYYCF